MRKIELERLKSNYNKNGWVLKKKFLVKKKSMK